MSAQRETLEHARTRLRYMAHRYVGCKDKDTPVRDRAGNDLEQAALTFAFAVAIWGQSTIAASPVSPEMLLEKHMNEGKKHGG